MPRIRPSPEGNWAVINHELFNGKLEDYFENTSLHLSFTDFELPLSVTANGNWDNEAYLVESPISIHDRGKWVADIDVMQAFKSSYFKRCPTCYSHVCDNSGAPTDLIAVDSWEEFLETPQDSFIVRANSNWIARLAIAALSTGQHLQTLIVPSNPCWHCYRNIIEEDWLGDKSTNQSLARDWSAYVHEYGRKANVGKKCQSKKPVVVIC
jgi:hypothetical protein